MFFLLSSTFDTWFILTYKRWDLFFFLHRVPISNIRIADTGYKNLFFALTILECQSTVPAKSCVIVPCFTERNHNARPTIPFDALNTLGYNFQCSSPRFSLKWITANRRRYHVGLHHRKRAWEKSIERTWTTRQQMTEYTLGDRPKNTDTDGSLLHLSYEIVLFSDRNQWV